MISHLIIYPRTFHAFIKKIELWRSSMALGRGGLDNKEHRGSFEFSCLRLACGNDSTPFPNTKCIAKE